MRRIDVQNTRWPRALLPHRSASKGSHAALRHRTSRQTYIYGSHGQVVSRRIGVDTHTPSSPPRLRRRKTKTSHLVTYNEQTCVYIRMADVGVTAVEWSCFGNTVHAVTYYTRGAELHCGKQAKGAVSQSSLVVRIRGTRELRERFVKK